MTTVRPSAPSINYSRSLCAKCTKNHKKRICRRFGLNDWAPGPLTPREAWRDAPGLERRAPGGGLSPTWPGHPQTRDLLSHAALAECHRREPASAELAALTSVASARSRQSQQIEWKPRRKKKHKFRSTDRGTTRMPMRVRQMNINVYFVQMDQ